MARKPKEIILDAWSILAYLEDEPAGSRVADLIADAHENGIALMMSLVNVGEVWYILARETSEKEADNSVAELENLGIELVEVDWKLTRAAAVIKAKHRMSFADCFAAALAREHNGQLVTGDKDFLQVEGEIKVQWL